MSFTEKENNAINEGLQGVQTPPVEEAWLKMSEMLGPPPVKIHFLQKLSTFIKLYLNVFIGCALLSSAVFLHSAVQKNVNDNSLHLEEALHVKGNNKAPFENELIVYNSQTLPIPSLTLLKENPIDALIVQPNFEVSENKVYEQMKASQKDEFVATKRPDKLSEMHTPENKVGLYDDEDEELDERWINKSIFFKEHFGVKFGIQFMPEVAFSSVARTISGGIFYRWYATPLYAKQIEVLYNPLNFRPITYVESSQINGRTVIDSALVKHGQYISIPMSLFHQPGEQISFNVGIQYSRLLALKGDVITKNVSQQGVETNPMKYQRVKNNDAFSRNDWAIVGEFSFQLDSRLMLGVKVQQSLIDQTKDKLGLNIHKFNSLQIKAAYILNKNR